MKTSIPWQSIIKVFKTWWALRELHNISTFSPDKYLNYSANALLESYTYYQYLHPSHLTLLCSTVSHFKFFIFLNPLLTSRPPSPYTAYPNTSRRILSLTFIISRFVDRRISAFLLHLWTHTVGGFVLRALIIKSLPLAWSRRKSWEGKNSHFIEIFRWNYGLRRQGRKRRVTQIFGDEKCRAVGKRENWRYFFFSVHQFRILLLIWHPD